MAGLLGLLALMLWSASHARWALYAAVAYLLVEIAYWVWDRRRLVEVRVLAGEAGGPGRLRVRRVGGRITEYDPAEVARVLVIHDNVVDEARLRLGLRRRCLFFGRPGVPPELAAWQTRCPGADVRHRNAWWGMPGVPD